MNAPDPATELQQEIERTRERLGETVAELAAKADLKARAKAAERYWPFALTAAGVVMIGAALIVRRRQA